MPIARVEPLTTARALRGPFDYRLGERFGDVGVGALLEVPFGRRRALGVVVELADRTDVPDDRLAEPLRALGSGITPELVALARWLAAAYVSTPARALALVLPPGVGTGGGPPPRLDPVTELAASLTEAGRDALADGARLTDGQRAVLERLRDDGPGRAADLGTAALRRLEGRGLVAVVPRPRRRIPRSVAVGARGSAEPPALTAAQDAALTRVRAALEAREPARLLLHGVTGSGKTEVYLRAAAAALAQGRDAIVLVPEIALTPQTVARFQARFGEVVALLHSGLGDGERADEWRRLRAGDARIAIGPRSAVFAPLRDVGLIVLDEEHDGSYKQDGDPRYDARRVAEERALLSGAVLLAGSATPRPESRSRYERLALPERVDARALPPVEVLDMRGDRRPLHARTRAALAAVRAAGEKAIVLLNRRGWSNFLACRDCGRVWECPNCDVTLVLHRAEGAVACHHCGHREPAPDRCPDCGSSAVARHGAGTERLEDDLRETLGADPSFPVLRLDADAARGKDGALDVLEAFDRAPAGVLLGTQMVAKGHDFPDVTLGVVLDADATLRFPDFRAEERTFSLVAQLAGRAGRGPRGGRVLVQTLAPDAEAIRLAAAHDSEGFLRAELGRREALGYPPFGQLVRVVCSSDAVTAPEAAMRAAEAVAARVAVPGGRVLGPAPLFRLKGRVRAQVEVRAPAQASVAEAVGAAVDAVAGDRAHRGVAFSVDVDPQ
jgi:primosomal protein N' (replication factor Y)